MVTDVCVSGGHSPGRVRGVRQRGPGHALRHRHQPGGLHGKNICLTEVVGGTDVEVHHLLYSLNLSRVSPCDVVFIPQGTIVLAAESEEEQVQWMEMLQDSGKV